MTVGGILLIIFISILILSIGGAIAYYFIEDREIVKGIIVIIISIGLIVGTVFLVNWYFKNTESGKRAIKTQESNFNKGIEREVKVYDVNGELIKEYRGKFDVDYDSNRIIFDDENNKRHVIYYTTGTVIIDEL